MAIKNSFCHSKNPALFPVSFLLLCVGSGNYVLDGVQMSHLADAIEGSILDTYWCGLLGRLSHDVTITDSGLFWLRNCPNL